MEAHCKYTTCTYSKNACACMHVYTIYIHMFYCAFVQGGASGEMINPECVVDEIRSNSYEVLLKVEEPGYYVGCVKYQGSVIGPPSISVISLSGQHHQEYTFVLCAKCGLGQSSDCPA